MAPVATASAVRASHDPGRGDQIASLNGLRAIAVTMVIASHLATAVSTPPSLASALKLFNGYLVDGALGVRIFFCISGFLITHLLLKERESTGRISLKTFYFRRALRIWPVFYAFVLFLAVVTSTTALVVTPCQFVTAITFTKNYGCSSWIDGHLWSLAVEQQFYLVWPAIIALGATRTSVRFAIAAILVAPFSRLIEANADLPQWWLTSNADALMAGALAAMLRTYHRSFTDGILAYRAGLARLAAFGLLVAPVLWHQTRPDDSLQTMFGPTLQVFSATYLILSLAFGPEGPMKRTLNLPVLNFLGLISYSLYIWQEPFFIWPSDFGFARLPTFEWPFNVLGMLTVAIASYYGLERPLLSLRKMLKAGRS